LSKNGQLEEALVIFEKNPTPFGASSLISAFGRRKKQGRGQSDLDLAFHVFDHLSTSSPIRDISVFRSLINVCHLCDQPQRSLPLLDEMDRQSLALDNFCFGRLIAACGVTGDVVTAKKLMKRMKDGALPFVMNVIDCNQLIQCFTKASHLQDALDVFHFMNQQGIRPDAITFICLLTCCANVGALEQGKQIHSQIINSGIKPDVVLGNALINMFGKCGSL